MKLIGLDSSGLVAGVAVVEDGILLAEYTTDYKRTHSQTLLPMLAELRDMLELDLNTVDAVAVASGPGSFTGLRIGAATAKGLGLALDKPLIEVPTLEGLAYNMWGTDKLVCPMMDARRNQVYTGIYEFRREKTDFLLSTVTAQCAVEVRDILERLNELGREVILLGDGAPVYRDIIEDTLRVPHSYSPAGRNRQRAANIAVLGSLYFAQGRTVTAMQHRPEYIRKGQAGAEQKEFLKL
ncbi:MAG: tRNA (adenosine(37)-N6)-threonylcarbamoyltransferase complex dimerization subunit type 1 TsaB [Lachnospiraceae bacterium]|nr:tRNA (adenosine(37)-N6)-threonylcarbamoyltransferase complex dimerization subunit type 1 TsaB [Lachnospiraceae bacterium]